jgi:hypothetical protein
VLLCKVFGPIFVAKAVIGNRRRLSEAELAESLRIPEEVFIPMRLLLYSSDILLMDESVARHASLVFQTAVQKLVVRDVLSVDTPFQLPYYKDLLRWFRNANPFSRLSAFKSIIMLRAYFHQVVRQIIAIGAMTYRDYDHIRMGDIGSDEFEAATTVVTDAQRFVARIIPVSDYTKWMQRLHPSAQVVALLFVGYFVAPAAFYPLEYPKALTLEFLYRTSRERKLWPQLEQLEASATQLHHSLHSVQEDEFPYPLQLATGFIRARMMMHGKPRPVPFAESAGFS